MLKIKSSVGLILASLSLGYPASAHDRVFIPGEQIVPSNKKVVIAMLAGLRTRAIYSSHHGIFPQNAKGLVIVIGGTGAAVSSDFGLVASLSPIVQKAANHGYGAIAFEQPIYFEADQPATREATILNFTSLDANLAWLRGIASFTETLIPTDVREAVMANLVFVGRSTGAAQLAEAVHSLARGRTSGSFLKGYRRLVMMGLDGHTQVEIDRWHRKEVAHFEAHPGTGDAAVYLSSPKLFGQMNWETVPITEPAATLPEGIFAIGAQDEFTHPKDQEVPINALLRNIPGLKATIVRHNGFHNPVKTTNRGTPMDAILDLALDPKPQTKARLEVFVPNDTIYNAALSLNTCNAELTNGKP